MFEDPNCGARQTGTQYQRRMIQLVTQNKTTLKQEKKNNEFNEFFQVVIFITSDLSFYIRTAAIPN